ncbi:SprT family protein [Enterococcus canis]|uniref:SprT family protein n=1 Tax=Enterococcus canis TaxID=214095 RepID=UPI00082D10CF|nr:SprT family protein [Enterococcus canis]
MTEQELQNLVMTISQRDFGRAFRHQARFNGRLRTTGGRYLLQSHHIEFNPKVYEQYGIEELVRVIKHELCHYHLHLTGRGYQHRDRDFKELLQKTGGSRYVQPLTEANYRTYRCQKCGSLIQRKRKVDTKRYVCGRCRGRLVEVEESK